MPDAVEAATSPTPMSEAINRLKRAADRAGLRGEDDIANLLLAMIDFSQVTTDRVDEAVASLIRRLDADKTPAEAVKIALTQTARETMERAARLAVHGERRRSWAVVGASVAVALGIGVAVGWGAAYRVAGQRAGWAAAELQAAFAGGTEGAAWLAQVARLNDTSALARDCQGNSYRTSTGGVACRVGLWTELPKAAAK